MSEKRILVTGGNGFVGRYCIRALDQLGLKATSVGLGQFSGKTQLTTHISLDISVQNNLENLVKELKPTHVLHLAWHVAHGDYWNSLKNIEMMALSIRLINEFIKVGGQRFVGVGTCAEYDWSLKGPYREDSPLKPNSLYGLIKKQTYETLHFLSEKAGTSFAWARPFYLFGFGEPKEKLVPSLLNLSPTSRRLTLTNDRSVKDFIYIKDAARALVSILLCDASGAVNVGTGKGHLTKDIVATLHPHLKSPDKMEWTQAKLNSLEVPFIVADTLKLSNLVKFKPEYSLESALGDYISEFYEI